MQYENSGIPDPTRNLETELFNQQLRDAADHAFAQMYREEPVLEQVAAAKATAVAERFMSESGQDLSHPATQTFVRAAKKMFFTFSSREDAANGLTAEDVLAALALSLQTTEGDIQAAANLADGAANFHTTLYKSHAETLLQGVWQRMTPSQQFWYVLGYADQRIVDDFPE